MLLILLLMLLSFLRECLEILGLTSPVYDWDPPV